MNTNVSNILKHITAETAVHLVMIVFALASVSNIHSYFVSSGHDTITSWAIGISLGLVLVSVSIMLTKVDFDNEKRTFYTVGAITASVALLSGTVQMFAYQAHVTMLQAILLGYGLPLVGECGLAVVTSMFSAAHKRQAIRSVTSNTESMIAATIADALSDIDVTKVRRYTERRVDQIVRHQVDVVASRFLPEPVQTQPESKPPVTIEIPSNPKLEVSDVPLNLEAPAVQEIESPEQVDHPESTNKTKLDGANEARKLSKLEAMNRAIEIYRLNPHASLSEVGRQIGRSKSTVGNYLSELEEQHIIYVNGSGVEVLG